MVKPPSRSVHMRRIILQTLLISVPMLASSTIVVYIVYVNIVSEKCLHNALCSGPNNGTHNGYYLIDFPAARLAFISSGSATVSFALLGVLMSMYAYVNATLFLRTSKKEKGVALPTPDQTAVMLKLLNGDMMVLWELVSSKVKRVFWYHEAHHDTSTQSPALLSRCTTILTAGIMAGLLVQAADAYFHVTAEAVQIVQYEGGSSSVHQFSRGLAPWCLNKPKFGDLGEEKFWGCAITVQQATYNNATSLAPTNSSIISDLKNGVSDLHSTITATDQSGTQYAIVGPASDDANLDWRASSFGVSTSCSAIPQTACNVSSPITGAKDGQNNPIMLVPFNCTPATASLSVLGNLTSHNTVTNMMNFHKYTAETAPFFDNKLARLKVSIPEEGIQDSNEVFKNGWSVLAMRKIPSAVQGDFSQLPPSFSTDQRIWKHDLLGAFVLLNCSVTVWDLTYSSINSKIALLSKSLSNGTVAGTASMPGTRQIGTLANIFQDESTGPLSRRSPDYFITSFELGMSKAYSYPLASQMSDRPSLLVQSRNMKVVTSLPITALWFLVAANFLYALLGWIVASFALLKLTEEVGQLQTMLTVEGLIAALCASEPIERTAVKDISIS